MRFAIAHGRAASAAISLRRASEPAETFGTMKQIRGDSICWLTEPTFRRSRKLVGTLEELRLRLNRDALLGLFDLELHYACYPPGAGYARHVDQPQGRGQRRVSLVLYLNRALGGVPMAANFEIFADDEGRRDIEPVAGRLVAFSDRAAGNTPCCPRGAAG